MKKIFWIFLICFGLCLSFVAGYQQGRSIGILELSWHPFYSNWNDYLKTVGHGDERIVNIHIKNGVLYVGTESGFVSPQLLTH